MSFHQERLPNGLDVVAEIDPNAVSAAIGFFVRCGARDESPEEAGVSHFLEHMAFKGSDRRSADDVNREFDEIGAKYNAYTTEEHTVYHAAILPEYLAPAIDLLAGLLRPALRDNDFETEKQVILEEISMYADLPQWRAYERAMRVHFADHPVGNSVLGTTASVRDLTPTIMRDYHGRRYAPGNVLVVAAGKLEWRQLLDLVAERCGGWPAAAAPRASARAHARGADLLAFAGDSVQENAFLLVPGPSADHSLRIAAEILTNVIGDDTGSRFYWELMEPGRVESLEMSYHEYEDVGAFMVSGGWRPELTEENLAALRRILADVTEKGIGSDELEQSRNKLRARVVLGSERPQSRFASLGYNWLYRKEYRTVDRDLHEIEQVSLSQIRAVLAEFPLSEPTMVCLGPVKKLHALQAVPE